MNLKTEIIKNWEIDIEKHSQPIHSLSADGFPCWTVKYPEGYGVAIPYVGDEEINEAFSNARIFSDVIPLKNGACQKAILLVADFSVSQEPFSALCEELVSPGENGEKRAEISKSPVTWWKSWKELLGNKDIDERVYDALGELCVFKYLLSQGKEADWDGPNSSTYDIEIETGFVEVKSTLSRSKKEVTISSQFQLDPPGKELRLVLCQFEPSTFNGVSIDSVVTELVELGISSDYLNSRLNKKGLEYGMSARKRTFILHGMLEYKVDDSFPRISPESFVGGVMPIGITKITYTVSLDGLKSTSLLAGENNEV